MATHRISVFGTLFPDASGSVFPELSSVALTNDLHPSELLRFKDTATKISASGLFNVPHNYVGTPKLYPVWTANATTNNVVWETKFTKIGGDDTTSLDPSAVTETASVTDAAPTAAFRRLIPAITLTGANYAADDTVEFTISRDGSSGSDTMAADALLFDLIFEYTDI
jgi:hypothetical protein